MKESFGPTRVVGVSKPQENAKTILFRGSECGVIAEVARR